MLKAKHRQGGTFGNTAWCVPGGSPGHEVGAKERGEGSEGWACQLSGGKAVQQVWAPSSSWNTLEKFLMLVIRWEPILQDNSYWNFPPINRSTKEQYILNNA